MLILYNSLSRAKEPFRPLAPPKVGMYVCGMTVYDYCHLGHARVMIVFDIVQRWLRASGYELTYVRNITDVDDKIIRRAAETGESIAELTARFTEAMQEDARALGVEAPDAEPRATRHVGDMQALIGRLVDRGVAYQAADGDVNFAVRAFPGYGKLSGKSLDDLRAGERVEISEAKRDPLDFVLWKRAKEGEPFWKSPWGAGRPGWHIECSAMSQRLLGEHIDIHGGGEDLQFPHHENEIAQSEGAAIHDPDKPFVNYWLHNAFVRVDEEKMSKSLGNFFTVREVLRSYDAEVVRFFIARAHYRTPINYSDANLDDARQSLARLYTALKGAPPHAAPPDWDEPHAKRFRAAMDDDFNTPEAVAVLFELSGEANRGSAPAQRQLRALGAVLGLLGRDADAFLKSRPAAAAGGLDDAAIASRIGERREARAAKDFARADAIRRELLENGVVLEDGAGGTTWRRA